VAFALAILIPIFAGLALTSGMVGDALLLEALIWKQYHT